MRLSSKRVSQLRGVVDLARGDLQERVDNSLAEDALEHARLSYKESGVMNQLGSRGAPMGGRFRRLREAFSFRPSAQARHVIAQLGIASTANKCPHQGDNESAPEMFVGLRLRPTVLRLWAVHRVVRLTTRPCNQPGGQSLTSDQDASDIFRERPSRKRTRSHER